MVRLKEKANSANLRIAQNFNSTMVRLKEYKGAEMLAHIAFQFHYGTIKRYWFFRVSKPA